MITNEERYDLVQFDCYNEYLTQRTVSLFNVTNSFISSRVNQIGTVAPSIPTPSFYILGSTNYWDFVRGSDVSPKMIRNIRIIADRESTLSREFNVNWYDITGQGESYSIIPYATGKSVYQYQSLIVDIPFKAGGWTVDQNMYINFTFPPSSVTSFILYYEEFNPLQMFRSQNMDICQDTDLCNQFQSLQAESVSEEELKEMLTTNIGINYYGKS